MAVCVKCIVPAIGLHPQCALSAPASAPTPREAVRPKTREAVRPPVRPSSAPLVPEVGVAHAGKSFGPVRPSSAPLLPEVKGGTGVKIKDQNTDEGALDGALDFFWANCHIYIYIYRERERERENSER